MQTVRVLAFAGAREVLGSSEITVSLPSPCTAADLLERVCSDYPRLLDYRGCIRVAINRTYASLVDPVQVGDEVALIPPVSGG